MKPFDRVVVVLGGLAVLSVLAMVVTAGGYVQGTRTASNFVTELTGLALVDDTVPELSLTIRIENDSPLPVELEMMHFSIYLNGNFVASNYADFEKMSLDGFEEETMTFNIRLQPFYTRYIREAQEGAGFSWSIRGRAKLILPFRENEVWLNIAHRWVGS